MTKNNLTGLIVGLLSSLIIIMFLIHQNDFIAKTNLDQTKKSNINEIFYYLTQNYYQKNQYYPEFIDVEVLKDRLPLNDPNGNIINSSKSAYTYKTFNCINNKCQNFSLEADLDLEADYIKTN